MKPIRIPKTPNCDTLIEEILQVVIDKNEDCIALIDKSITDKEVILTFDETKCQPV